jgi:NADH:ubiquinone oxidoreductase subunit F (NADH-binding)
MGGSIPESLLDTPPDFDELSKLRAAIGAGNMLVLDEDTNMVDVTRYFLDFLTNESCGKCVPYREGIRQMLKILTNICDGKGKEGDIEILEEIALKECDSCKECFELCPTSYLQAAFVLTQALAFSTDSSPTELKK